ncbi:MAG: glycoside hydrolase family 31 protein [Bacteroidales bacterium]
MRKYGCFWSVCFSLLSFQVLASEPVVKSDTVVCTPGEEWWGGMVALGNQMPFQPSGKVIDLSKRNNNNQSSSLLLSSAGRYIYSKSPFAFRRIEGGVVIQSGEQGFEIVSAGKSLREAHLGAMQRHFAPDGTIPDSLFFVQPQYNTWIELLYDQNQRDIIRYANKIKEHDFPVGIFMIDDNWQRYYGNFEFKAERFPDPKGMIEGLHRDGFRVMLWVCPFVSADSPEFRELNRKGYLIRRKGSPAAALIQWWNGYSACYDLTNPEAKAYLIAQLKEVQRKYGVDGFKFDAGDPELHVGEFDYHDPKATSVDFCQHWSEVGLSFPYNEFRASWNFGNKPLVQRLGDKDYSWGALSLLVSDMISAGLLGYSYTCPDMIGGGQFASFQGVDRSKLDQKLIVRSCQIHAMMPMMQYSVAPWNILDEAHLQLCREANELHQKFSPYITALARGCAETGEPIVRSMEYVYPGEGFAHCKDQYMLGDRYLVAPVLSREDRRSVRLPAGRWIDPKGKRYKGGRSYTFEVPLDEVLYFERQ